MNTNETVKLFGQAPDKSEHKYYFETEFGSKYVLTETNKSRRLKFDGSGLHDWKYKCIFIKDYSIISNFDTAIRHCFQTGIHLFLTRNNDYVELRYFNRSNNSIELLSDLNQIMTNRSGIINRYHFEYIPTLGANVFEFDINTKTKELCKFHPGHEVILAQKLQGDHQ